VAASASARRYAAAAFSVAAESGDLDGWLATVTELARILRMRSARTIFTSPAVPTNQKRAALDRLLPTASPVVRNFVHILADRDRLAEVPGIAEALHELINQRRGIVTAEVTTAIPLDAEMERVLAERLAAYLNRDPTQVTIHAHVDPNIIGGVVARIGDRLIDDSVRGRLDRLRRTLAGSSR
jgi:F-type H+-transporting ATPase subunit delta